MSAVLTREAVQPILSPQCPVCGTSKWREPLIGTRLRRCHHCDTYLNDRSADRAEEERLYDHCESQAVQDTHDIAAVQWKWVSGLIEGRAGLRVLDIGCGSGAFLAAARASAAEVHGLELDPAGIATARAAGIPVTAGSLFDQGLPVGNGVDKGAGTWDVISFWDVLDHLEWPDRALRMAAESLAPGGVLAVRGRNAAFHVPLKARRSRWPGLHARLAVPDVSVVHRWGFSASGWSRLLVSAGLTDVRLSPGLPTPGDRYGSLQSRSRAALLKSVAAVVGTTARVLTGGRSYLYPSVLLSGRAPR